MRLRFDRAAHRHLKRCRSRERRARLRRLARLRGVPEVQSGKKHISASSRLNHAGFEVASVFT